MKLIHFISRVFWPRLLINFFLAASTANPKNIDYLLGNHKNGQAVVIVIGGTREVYCLDQNDNQIDLVLLNRKGFVKKALKHGADLVPTFTFGEAFLFSNMFSNCKGSFLRKMQLHVLAKTGCPVPLFFGRGIFNYSFGVAPRRQPLTIVGKFLFSKKIIFIMYLHGGK